MYPSISLFRFVVVAAVVTVLFILCVEVLAAAAHGLQHEVMPYVHAVNGRLAQEHQAVEQLTRSRP